MADPLSITASIITLLQVSVHVSVLLKQFRDEVSVVNSTLDGLLGDVEGFHRVLEAMRETFDQDEVKDNLQQATGHVGNHWKNLARSMEEGTVTLQQLRELLETVNKTTSFLDGPRKQLRLKSAIDQIAGFRERIQSYCSALQLSLNTVMLWNQYAFQKTTEDIPARIQPHLDKLYGEFRSFASLLSSKIETLQGTLDQKDQQDLIHMTHLRETVKSAAEVASTASSGLTIQPNQRGLVRAGSDLGDVFPRDINLPMRRWITANTVYEYEDAEVASPPPESSAGSAPMQSYSDSDSETEMDIVKALFQSAQKKRDKGDFPGARRLLSNCLKRTSANSSTLSLRSPQSKGLLRYDVLQSLTEISVELKDLEKAKSHMLERLVIIERQVGSADEKYFWELTKLSEILKLNQELVEAQLQGRRALKGFKKMGRAGYHGYERSLLLLVEISQIDGKADEEDGYHALLTLHQMRVQEKNKVGSEESLDDGREGTSQTTESDTICGPQNLESKARTNFEHSPSSILVVRSTPSDIETASISNDSQVSQPLARFESMTSLTTISSRSSTGKETSRVEEQGKRQWKHTVDEGLVAPQIPRATTSESTKQDPLSAIDDMSPPTDHGDSELQRIIDTLFDTNPEQPNTSASTEENNSFHNNALSLENKLPEAPLLSSSGIGIVVRAFYEYRTVFEPEIRLADCANGKQELKEDIDTMKELTYPSSLVRLKGDFGMMEEVSDSYRLPSVTFRGPLNAKNKGHPLPYQPLYQPPYQPPFIPTFQPNEKVEREKAHGALQLKPGLPFSPVPTLDPIPASYKLELSTGYAQVPASYKSSRHLTGYPQMERKVILMGGSGCGMSSLITSWVTGRSIRDLAGSLVDTSVMHSKDVFVYGTGGPPATVRLIVQESPGDRAIVETGKSGRSVIVLCISLDRNESKTETLEPICSFVKALYPDLPKFIVVCKADLRKTRGEEYLVSRSTITDMASIAGAFGVFETSAMDHYMVDDFFYDVADFITTDHDSRKKKRSFLPWR